MAARTAESTAARSSSREVVQSDLLADKLERWIIRSKSYWIWVVGILGVATVGTIVFAMISGAADKREAEAWTEIYFAQTEADRLETIAENFSGTTAGLWAMQKSGDATFSRAQSQIYLDRAIALQLLAEARQWYQGVLEEARDPRLIARATIGVAQTYDAAAEVDQAINEYKRLLAMPDVNGQLKQIAAERIAFLESEDGREFFEWFRNNAPSDPRPVGTAEDLKQLPAEDDLQFSPPADQTRGAAGESPTPVDVPAANASTAQSAATEAGSSLELSPPVGDSEESATPAEPADESAAEPEIAGDQPAPADASEQADASESQTP